MEVDVLYFQSVRKLMGLEKEKISLGVGATVADLITALQEKRPPLAAAAKSLLVAVNQEHSSADRVLSEGDMVAIMPPFSGG